ncbi:MAG: T9SS type A sorting domain-containing protein [Bacteroidota bacterium]
MNKFQLKLSTFLLSALLLMQFNGIAQTATKSVLSSNAMSAAVGKAYAKAASAGSGLPVNVRAKIASLAKMSVGNAGNGRAKSVLAASTDTVYEDSWSGDWAPANAHVFYHNSMELESEHVIYSPDFSQANEKSTTSYDAAGRVTSVVEYLWDFGQSAFRPASKDTTAYDSFGNKTYEAIYSYDGLTWTPFFENTITNTYNAQGNIQQIVQNANTGFGINIINTFNVKEYGTDGRVMKMQVLSDFGGMFLDSSMVKFSSWHNWVNPLPDFSQPDTIITQTYFMGSWFDIQKDKYEYGSNESVTETTYELNDSREMAANWQSVTEYDALGNVTLSREDSIHADGSRLLIAHEEHVNRYNAENKLYQTVILREFPGGAPLDSVQRFTYGKPEELTAITPHELQGQVKAFPNPFNDKLEIALPAGYYEADYSVSDLSGRIITNGKLAASGNSVTLNTELLNAGFYMLSIKTGNKATQVIKVSKAG